jgi:hypothetical protein
MRTGCCGLKYRGQDRRIDRRIMAREQDHIQAVLTDKGQDKRARFTEPS